MKTVWKLISSLMAVGGFLSMIFSLMAMVESMGISIAFVGWFLISVLILMIGGCWYLTLDDDFEDPWLKQFMEGGE